MKNKQAATVPKAIDQFITENKVTALMSHNGSEFTNDRVEKFLDKNLITHANSIPGDHTVLGKLDRFIRTIKAGITKMQDTIDFKKLTQKLLKYPISNYNDTTHSSILFFVVAKVPLWACIIARCLTPDPIAFFS